MHPASTGSAPNGVPPLASCASTTTATSPIPRSDPATRLRVRRPGVLRRASALLELVEFRPSVCLIDLNMPGMDGDELAIRLRNQGHAAGSCRCHGAR